MELAEAYVLEQKNRLLRQYGCATLQEVIVKLEATIKLKSFTP